MDREAQASIWSSVSPAALPAVTVMSAEPTSSRLIRVRLAAAAGAAAKPTPSGSTLRNPAAIACAAAELPKPAASRTICIDVATCRTIQYPKSLGASAATNYTGGRGESVGAAGACSPMLNLAQLFHWSCI